MFSLRKDLRDPSGCDSSMLVAHRKQIELSPDEEFAGHLRVGFKVKLRNAEIAVTKQNWNAIFMFLPTSYQYEVSAKLMEWTKNEDQTLHAVFEDVVLCLNSIRRTSCVGLYPVTFCSMKKDPRHPAALFLKLEFFFVRFDC